MINRILFGLLILAQLAGAACTKTGTLLDWTTANGISRANLNYNPILLKTTLDGCIDSVNALLGVLPGYGGSLMLSSNQDLVLKVDADANGTNRFVVLGNGADSILRINEDSTARFFRHLAIDSNLTVRKVTASDTLMGANLKTSGTATVSGNLTAAKGTFSDTVLGANIKTAGSLTVTGNGTIAKLAASDTVSAGMLKTGGNLSVTGSSSLTGASISGGSSGQGNIYTTSTVGLALQSKTGSLYDFSLLGTGGIGNYVMRVGTGTNNAEFPNNVTVGGTLGVTGIQTNSAAITFGGTGGAADWTLWRSATNGLAFRGGAGTSYDFSIFTPASNYLIRNPTGTQGLEFPGTGTQAFSGPVTMASTLGVTGLLTATGGILPGPGADGAGRIFQSSVNGLKLRGVTGSSNDLGLFAADGTLMLRNPTGTTGLTLNTATTFADSLLGSSERLTGNLVAAGAKSIFATNTTDSTIIKGIARVNGWLRANDSILGTTGRLTGNFTADSIFSTKVQKDSSFTLTLNFGGSSSGTTATGYVTRDWKTVTYHIPKLQHSCVGTDAITITGRPANTNPARDQSFTVPIQLATATLQMGRLVVAANGTDSLFSDAGTTSFSCTSAQSHGSAHNITVTYTLQ